MADEPTTPVPQGEMQTGTNPKPEIGKPSANGEMPGTTTPPESLDDLKRELENVRTALKKANTEAAGHRKKAEELDKLKADQEAATLSETQKLQKQLTKLQSDHDNTLRTHQERTINYEVRLQAMQAGIVDPDAASKLLDWAAIEYDDNGQPSNVDKLLKDLIKAKPYLAGKAQPTSGGATNPSRTQSGTGEITEQYAMDVLAGKVAGLTPQEIAKVAQWVTNNNTNHWRRR